MTVIESLERSLLRSRSAIACEEAQFVTDNEDFIARQKESLHRLSCLRAEADDLEKAITKLRE